MKKRFGSPIFILCATGFCLFASFSMIIPILPIYARDQLNASTTEIGLITSIFFIASVISRIPFGAKAGGRNTPIAFLISLLVFIALPIGYAQAHDSFSLTLIRALHGITFAVFSTTGFFMVPLTLPAVKRTRALSNYTAAVAFGLMAGPIVTAPAVAAIGLRNTFYLASLIGLIGVLAAFVLVWRILSIERKWQVISERIDDVKLASKVSVILGNRVLIGAFMGAFGGFFIFGVFAAFVPVYANQAFGFSAEQVSAMFFGYYAFSAVARLFVGEITRAIRLGYERSLIIYLTVSVALVLAISVEGLPSMFVLIFVLSGFFQGILFPLSAMILMGAVKPSELVLANSLDLVAVDIGLGLGPIAASLVASRYGFTLAFSSTGLIVLVVVLIILFLQKDVLTKAKNGKSVHS